VTYILFHFTSGCSLFSGVAIIIAAVAAAFWIREGRSRWLVRGAAAVGMVFVLGSTTPFPGWAYGLWVLLVALWIYQEWRRGERWDRPLVNVGVALAVVSLVMAGVELPHHITPTMAEKDHELVYLVGDSISAGIGWREDRLWPQLVSDWHDVRIVSVAREGERVTSALDMAQFVKELHTLVILEIGGNDILNSTSERKFGENLEELIQRVKHPTRTLVMFELPLPPFYHEFGRVQRRLAKRHGIFLIPKRVFARVLGTPGNTIDGIHLSEEGHAMMARAVWGIIRPAVKPSGP